MTGVIPLPPYAFAACVGTTLPLDHYHICTRHGHVTSLQPFPLPTPNGYVQCLALLSRFVGQKASAQARAISWLTLSYAKLWCFPFLPSIQALFGACFRFLNLLSTAVKRKEKQRGMTNCPNCFPCSYGGDATTINSSINHRRML